MAIRLMFSLLMVSLFFGCSDHGNSTENFLERNVAVDGKEYRYRVFLPKSHGPNTKIAVMLYLHGSGSRGDDNFSQMDSFRLSAGPVMDKFNFVVVLPQCKPDSFWSANDMANYSLAALDQAVKEFNGDEKRLYLVGFSLGGYGVWQIAAAHPNKFAALVPVSGGVVGERPIAPADRAAIIPEVGTMLDSPEPYKAVAAAIGQTSVWAFHGSVDESVPVEFSRTIIRSLSEAGNRHVKYTEYQGEGHMIFGKAIREPGFLEWLGEQKLK